MQQKLLLTIDRQCTAIVRFHNVPVGLTAFLNLKNNYLNLVKLFTKNAKTHSIVYIINISCIYCYSRPSIGWLRIK